jgi:uncharacterized protein YsxB (DUF464 family)
MIHITFVPQSFELTVDGHAGHGKKGEDIVCAAISTLFYTLGEALYQSEDMMLSPLVFEDKDGKGYIKCSPKEEYAGNIVRTYWSILVGMELVANNYPDNVTFQVGG